MKNIIFFAKLLSVVITFLTSQMVLAAQPVFTFTPTTATILQLYANDTATVKYIVQNQSHQPHTIKMVAITGITQVTSAGNCSNPFVLGFKQSCKLTLTVNASQLGSGVHTGPVVCQQGPDGNPSPFLCVRPSLANILNITILPFPQYTVISKAGAQGTVTPGGSQKVIRGNSLLFKATAKANYVVYQWLLDGVVAQTGGTSFLLANITANHQLQVTFTSASVFYSGAQNGKVYYSFNEGVNWTATPQRPASSNPINSVFVTANTLYTGNANGFVYYSTNNGASWQVTRAPDGTEVNSVFARSGILYAGTNNGFVYHSSNNGTSWQRTSAPDGSALNAIFATSTRLYAGTANGNVYYSANKGASWLVFNGKPDGSAIRSIFISNGNVYVGTVNEYAYSSPTGGGSWSAFSQTVYSLFVEAMANITYAATQGGYVYSITGGTELGFVDYTMLNSLYVLN